MEKLATQSQTDFEAGKINVPTMNVCRQLRYEARKKGGYDKDIFKSLRILRQNWIKLRANNVVKGYVQLLNEDPLRLVLFLEEDVVFFHKMSPRYTLVVDATTNIVKPVNEDEKPFYFGFTMYNPEIIASPLPFLQMITDDPDEVNLKLAMDEFSRALKMRYDNNIDNRPLLVVCDCSWAIKNAIVSHFNRMEVNNYPNVCYNTLNGDMEYSDLPYQKYLTVVHCCAHLPVACYESL